MEFVHFWYENKMINIYRHTGNSVPKVWSANNLTGKFKALPMKLLDREKFYGIF